MRSVLKIFTLLVLLMAYAGEARASRCWAPTPEFGFKATISKTKYNISESAFELHRAFNGIGSGLVMGLAYSPLYYDFDTLFSIRQTEKGYCVAIDKMKFIFRARPIVFISSEFPRGSCEFDAVLFHENKHVKTLRRVHKEYSPKIRQRAQDVMERIRPEGPLQKGQVQAAKKKMLDEFDRLMGEYLTEIHHILGREQNKVDSAREYERVNAECDGWNARLRLE